MKMSNIFAALGILALCAICFWAGRRSSKPEVVEKVRTDTLVVWDTVKVDSPIPYVSRELKDSLRLLVAVNSYQSQVIDSLIDEIGNPPMDTIIEVSVPRWQKEYVDEQYRAWVSGYDPALDSIRVYSRTHYVTMTVRETAAPKRWHIGPTVGMGIGTADGKVVTTPYVGIGVTYSILSF